jgi:ribosomal protein S18
MQHQQHQHQQHQRKHAWPHCSTILMTQSFATQARPTPENLKEEKNDNEEDDEEEEDEEDNEDEEEEEEFDEDDEEEFDEDENDEDFDHDEEEGELENENDEEEDNGPSLDDVFEPLDEDEARDVVDDVREVADSARNIHFDLTGAPHHGLPRAVELNVEVARRHQRLIDANEHEFASFIRSQYFLVDGMHFARMDEEERDLAEQEAIFTEERRQILVEMKEEGIEQTCRLCRPGTPMLDPLNVGFLARHLTAYGTIKPRKMTYLCAKHQRKLNKAVRRARHMGIFSNKNKTFTVHSPFEDLIMERTDQGEWQVRPKPIEGVERKPGLTADDDPFPDMEIDHEKTAALEREYLSTLSEADRRAYLERQRRIENGEDPDADEYYDDDEDVDDDDDDDAVKENGENDDDVDAMPEMPKIDEEKLERQVEQEMAESEITLDIDDDADGATTTRRRGRK